MIKILEVLEHSKIIASLLEVETQIDSILINDYRKLIDTLTLISRNSHILKSFQGTSIYNSANKMSSEFILLASEYQVNLKRISTFSQDPELKSNFKKIEKMKINISNLLNKISKLN